MKKLNLAVVGCGATTEVMFGPIFRYLEGGRFYLAMDPDIFRAKRAQKLYGCVRVTSKFEEVLEDKKVDALIIGSPVPYHFSQVIQAAEAKKHILCEKPMARTVKECEKMVSACKKKGVILMIGFMKRYNKCFRLATRLIQEGRLGKIFEVYSRWSWFSSSFSGWRVTLPTWGGIFQDHGSHVVNLAQWWLGEVESVSAEFNILSPSSQVENQAVVLLRHRKGGISIHQQSALTHKPLEEYYLIDGTRASLEIEFGPAWSFTSLEPFKMTLYEEGKRKIDLTPYNEFNRDEEIRKNNQYLKELEHFIECIKEGKEPLTPGEQGKEAIEVINAAYLSSFKREKIKLPLKETPNLEKIFLQTKPFLNFKK